MIQNPINKKVGLVGMVIGAIGVIVSLKNKKVIPAILFSVLFVYSYIFYTGSDNYAVVMFGASKMNVKEHLERPVIEAKNNEDLKSFMSKKNKTFLWLPCAKGGDWYKQSVYFYTKWNLPSEDVQCPDGRYLIKYGS